MCARGVAAWVCLTCLARTGGAGEGGKGKASSCTTIAGRSTSASASLSTRLHTAHVPPPFLVRILSGARIISYVQVCGTRIPLKFLETYVYGAILPVCFFHVFWPGQQYLIPVVYCCTPKKYLRICGVVCFFRCLIIFYYFFCFILFPSLHLARWCFIFLIILLILTVLSFSFSFIFTCNICM